MSKLLATTTTLVFALSLVAAGCASDEPRYADPPPGSHSPFAEPDERGGGEQTRDEPDPPDPEAEEEDEMPPPERD